MKKLLKFIAMALPILASGITPQQADQIVQSRIPGKHQEGHCTEYALNLGNTLERMKVPYSRIHYIWWDNGKSQMHVIVWFKTSDGQGWLADNETSHPIKEDGDNTGLPSVQIARAHV